MKIRFLDVVVMLLLVVGPTIGYRAAVRAGAKRWLVMLCSAAGAAVAATMLIIYLFVLDMTDTAAQPLRQSAVFVGECALFGLVLGLAALLLRVRRRRFLLLCGVAMLGVNAAIAVAIDAVHPPPDYGASGVVFGPDGLPAAGTPVYLDRGDVALERLTTDSTGFFRAPLETSGYRRAVLLICVPGAASKLVRPVEHSLTPARYQIYPLPAGLYLGNGIRVEGWRRQVPRNCLVGPSTRFEPH